jgi:hypothetical protein
VPLIALAVLVSFCVLRERTAHARLLTLLSLIAGCSSCCSALISRITSLAAEPTRFSGRSPHRDTGDLHHCGRPAGQAFQAQAVPRRLPAGIRAAPYQESLPATPPDQRLQQPGSETAAGAVLATAGEAAAGAPAAGWGAEANSAAWQPIPTQPNGPQSQGSNWPQPQGNISHDPAIRSKGQRDAQPPAVDWWGRPQS